MTRVKICGITTLTDAIAAIEEGADLLGFNFYAPSPRSISSELCRQITTILRKDYPDITLVGVFVNMPEEDIHSIMRICSLNLAQLHGDETPDVLASFHGKAFKAFRGVPKKTELDKYISVTNGLIPALLLDATVRGTYGGSGVVADWSSASGLSSYSPMLLAGGLTPENVQTAINLVHPWGVDVASGVELSPGRKDHAKITAFMQAVRSVT